MATKKTKAVPFRMLSISTDYLTIDRDNYLGENEEFDIGLAVDVKVNNADYLTGVYTTFNFNHEDKPVFTLKCGCHFQIKASYWDQQIQNGKLRLPSHFLTHLLVLSVGTARGIIHASRPEWLKNVFLPTIDVSRLIKDDMIFDLGIAEEE